MLQDQYRTGDRNRIFCSILALLCGLSGVIGCGGSKGPPLYTAKGIVKVDGKPAAGALVVLHPVDKDQTIRPGGEADDEGQFILTSVKQGDGAPAGEYKVAVHWLDLNAPPPPGANAIPSAMGGEGESKSDPVDRLQGRYSHPDTSGLKCTISDDGENEIPTFELKSDFGTPVQPGGSPIIDGA